MRVAEAAHTHTYGFDHEQSFGTVTELFFLSSTDDDNEEAEKKTRNVVFHFFFFFFFWLFILFSNILTARKERRKKKINGPLRQQLSSSFPSVQRERWCIIPYYHHTKLPFCVWRILLSNIKFLYGFTYPIRGKGCHNRIPFSLPFYNNQINKYKRGSLSSEGNVILTARESGTLVFVVCHGLFPICLHTQPHAEDKD